MKCETMGVQIQTVQDGRLAILDLAKEAPLTTSNDTAVAGAAYYDRRNFPEAL